MVTRRDNSLTITRRKLTEAEWQSEVLFWHERAKAAEKELAKERKWRRQLRLFLGVYYQAIWEDGDNKEPSEEALRKWYRRFKRLYVKKAKRFKLL